MTILITIINKPSVMDEELERIRAKRVEEMKQRIITPTSIHMGIQIINSENFNHLILENPRLIVDFWAPWCGPCQMLTPVIEELSQKYSGNIRFAKCNTDENQQIAYQYGISAIPTLFFFNNGSIIHTVAGALPKDQLEAVIRSVYSVV